MRSRHRFAAAVTAGIIGTGGIALTHARAAVIYQEVAATTLAVPVNAGLTYTTAGAPNADTTETTNQIGGETFSTFSVPCINQAGDTVFSAVDSGASNVQTTQTTTLAQNINALYAQINGTLTQVAHEGTYAPDRAGSQATAADSTGTFSTLNGLSATTTGEFIGTNDVITDYSREKANKTSGGSDDSTTSPAINLSSGLSTIYSTRPGSLALSYRVNDLIGTQKINALDAGTVTTFIAVNPSGNLALQVDAGVSSVSAGIASDSGATIHFVAQGGTATPISGTTYNASGFVSGNAYPPVINASAQTAFRAPIVGTNINASSNVAIFSEGGGTYHLVAQAFAQVPSLPLGDAYLYSSLGNPDMNNSGMITFSDGLTNNSTLGAGDIVTTTNSTTGVTANNSALFVENPTTTGVTVVARRGNQAFGQPTGSVYSSFNNPVISDSGRIACEVGLSNASNAAALTPGTTSTFYEFDPNGTVTLVEQNGTIAPGTSLYFNNIATNNYAINGQGEIAFESALSATINGSTVASGLFAQDASGALNLLVETGQSFTIAPGDISTVTSITALSNSGGEDGRTLSWNDGGTVAVDLNFANGQSGVYTISVPEPAMVMPLILAGCGLLGRRGTKRNAT